MIESRDKQRVMHLVCSSSSSCLISGATLWMICPMDPLRTCTDISLGQRSSAAASTSAVNERRRINPQSLALRLPPDLVRDMEALILPGNVEMPSFAVRRELQKRYNVDRRHIYDYFHSRGLRVLKESKSDNSPLTAGPPLHGLRCLKPAPQGKNLAPAMPNIKGNTFKSHGITKTKPRHPWKKGIVHSMSPPEISDATPMHVFSEPAITPKYVAVNPLLPLQPNLSSTSDPLEEGVCTIFNPLDEPLGVECDLACSHRPKLACDQMSDPPTHTDWQECSMTSPNTDTGFSSHTNPDPLGSERQAIYQSLSDSLGPPCGIQECVGTYKYYMQDYSRIYYEPLINCPSIDHTDKPAQGVNLVRVLVSDTNEFQSWLSSGEIPECEGRYSCSRIQFDVQRLVSRQHSEVGLSRTTWPDHLFGQTLDDLFPALPQELPTDAYDVTISPVVRSHMQPSVAFHLSPLLELECDGTEEVDNHSLSRVNSPPLVLRQLRKIPWYRSDSHEIMEVTHLEANVSGIDLGRSTAAEQCFVVSSTDDTALSGANGITEHITRYNTRKARVRPQVSVCSPYRSSLREWDGVRTRSTRNTRTRTTSAGGI
ncbi:hypothetical protein V8B97DRAFT_959210 [Scleroderma yunnanense]